MERGYTSLLTTMVISATNENKGGGNQSAIVTMSLDAIRERGKQQQVDADVLESVLDAVVE